MRRTTLFVVMMVFIEGPTTADDTKKETPKKIEAFTDAKKAGPDFAIQGEYLLPSTVPDLDKVHAAQVIALGDGTFEIRCSLVGGLPGQGWNGKSDARVTGRNSGGRNIFENSQAVGAIDDRGTMTLTTPATGSATLARVVRQSPTLGQKPPAGGKVLFDGTITDQWDKGQLVDGNLLKWGTTSKAKFGDCTIHLEFRLPFMPQARGQERANSGVYVQGRYEVQVLDSFGLSGKDNECGGIYQVSAPKINMCYPPLSWQTYDIDFVAAKFDSTGKKGSDAVVTVWHNGVVIQDKVKIPGPTGGSLLKESAEPGPIHLQDHGDPVVYRNIWVNEKKAP